MIKSRHFIIFLILVLHHTQLAFGKNRKARENSPKAIFVQLPTFQSRVKSFEAANAKERLAELKRDCDSLTAKQVMDFTDNFSFCPVYYYIDTNFYRIINGQVNGVFLDKNLKPANPSLTPSDNYFLVMFGYPIPGQYDIDTATGRLPEFAYSNVHKSQRLVVLNKKKQLVKRPNLNHSFFIFDGVFVMPESDYIYNSKHFDIYYRPYAKYLDRKLKMYYKTK